MTISKKEQKFIIIIGLTIIFLAFFPLVFGWIMTPPDKVFLFISALNERDYSVYYSWIEQVKDGNFLLKNLYTSEKQDFLFFNPFWLVVGIFAKIFFLPSFLAFHIVRFLLIIVFLIVAYYFVSFFFNEEIKRKICFILLTLASGFGWLFLLISYKMDFWYTNGDFIPIDLYVSDAFSFLTMYNNPHFLLSLILIALIFLFSLFVFENYRFVYSLLAGFLALVLFSFHPYHIPTIFLVLFVFIIVDIVISKKINLDYLKHFLLLLIFSLPPIIYYYYYWINGNTDRHQQYLQNITLTPHFLILLISYGLLMPLAFTGTFSIFKKREKNKKEIFLIVWLFTQISLIYFPINVQRRFIEGLQLVFSVLAVFGLFYLYGFSKINKAVKNIYKNFCFSNRQICFFWIFISFIVLFFISNIAMILRDLNFSLEKDELFYIPKTKQEAMVWLKENIGKDSIVLSSVENGKLIPFLSLRPVYIGHEHETQDFLQKEKKLTKFIKETDAQKKLLFLRDNSIEYLFFDKEEKKKFKFNPDNYNFLKKVYNNGSAAIYKINY